MGIILRQYLSGSDLYGHVALYCCNGLLPYQVDNGFAGTVNGTFAARKWIHPLTVQDPFTAWKKYTW